MFTETLRAPEDVCAGEEVLLPREGTWAVVKSISGPDDDDIVWMSFPNGEGHGFHAEFLVTVRRPIPAPAAPLAPQPAPAAQLAPQPAPAAQLAPQPAPAAPLAPQFAPAAQLAPQPVPVQPAPAQLVPAAQLARQPAPARALAPAARVQWLTATELYELARLRTAAPPSNEPPGKTNLEDLDRLRRALRTELGGLRVTTAQYPCSAGVDPVDELLWRRGLVPFIKAAEEQARKEEARREREAKAWQAAQHVTLSEPERRWQELLRAEDAAFGVPAEEENELTWSTLGDCGRKHWSPSASSACANVRSEEAERAEARRLPPKAPLTRPSTATAQVAQPPQVARVAPQGAPQARASTPTTRAPSPATLTGTTRQADRGAQPQPDRGEVEREAPAKEPPLWLASSRPSTTAPTPQAPSPPVDYAARILTAVAQTHLRSARAVFRETGGNKLAVFDTIKLMLGDGRLVTDSEGVYRVGNRVRNGAV